MTWATESRKRAPRTQRGTRETHQACTRLALIARKAHETRKEQSDARGSARDAHDTHTRCLESSCTRVSMYASTVGKPHGAHGSSHARCTQIRTRSERCALKHARRTRDAPSERAGRGRCARDALQMHAKVNTGRLQGSREVLTPSHGGQVRRTRGTHVRNTRRSRVHMVCR